MCSHMASLWHQIKGILDGQQSHCLRVNQTHILIATGPSSRRSLLLSTMNSHGLEPSDIDIVILTHLHWDHCQNTDLFTNSKILVHPRELDYAKSPKSGDWATVPLINEILSKMDVNPVSDGDEVTDGVKIVDTSNIHQDICQFMLKAIRET